jgi:hypothetical protein
MYIFGEFFRQLNVIKVLSSGGLWRRAWRAGRACGGILCRTIDWSADLSTSIFAVTRRGQEAWAGFPLIDFDNHHDVTSGFEYMVRFGAHEAAQRCCPAPVRSFLRPPAS